MNEHVVTPLTIDTQGICFDNRCDGIENDATGVLKWYGVNGEDYTITAVERGWVGVHRMVGRGWEQRV
ncbi:hypothetical protein GIB67_005224 [Kingdonia uniflora]|uniref:Uncharacterized protein n=1 Tax=Kingdonia uniflora TaxID=39325 RepID=A0A7J7NNT3_9MAGN|nr:hypothetical protein GIB67_005224 [Kingdonia uniflora]